MRPPTERKLVLSLAVAGVFVPFGVGALVVPYLDASSIIGPANNELALLLVFATAVAIASIPVISRIMLDLGIMQTSFARVVISTAIIDDLVLYIVLAVAVGLTQTAPAAHIIPTWLVSDAASFWSPLYHVAATLLTMAFLSVASPPLLRLFFSTRWSWLRWDGGAVSQASFLLVAVALCAALKVNPMFGALAAGLAVARASQDSQASHSRTLAVAGATFFTPLFFAITGFKIDLIHHFDPILLIGFLSFSCIAKAVCTYAGARLAGETHRMALNFAAALNARGGPGIVLAGVALESHIINENFFATLVMTAVLTSLMAGVWLGYAMKGKFFRLESDASPATTRQRLVLAES